MICLDEGILRAHLDGELTEYETLSVQRHLSLCDDCCRSYETIVARRQSLDSLFADVAPRPSELRTDAFAAQCAFTRFKAQYEVDFDTVTFVRPATTSLSLLLAEPGNLLTRLFSSFQQFIRDFGKRAPRTTTTNEFSFLLPDEALVERLPRAARANWEEFRRNPYGFLSQLWQGDGSNPVRRRRLQTGTVTAMASYLLVFTTLIVAGVLRFDKNEPVSELKGLTITRLASPPPIVTTPQSGPANVPGGKGGTIGGNKPQADPARGGGGGGRRENTPASFGNPPQVSPLPQVIPPNPEPFKSNAKLVVADTTIGEDSLSNPLPRPTGLKDGAEVPPASGSGGNAGMGTGQGTGLGPGIGTGQGPGRINNQGNGDRQQGGGLSGAGAGIGDKAEIYEASYNLQPKILFKERASYTEEAQQHALRGSVILSAVFGADGQLRDIQVVQGLPYGLTESAITAMKKIKFRPAVKNGAPVNVRMAIAYSFNIM